MNIKNTKSLSYAGAINEALDQSMSLDKNILLIIIDYTTNEVRYRISSSRESNDVNVN